MNLLLTPWNQRNNPTVTIAPWSFVNLDKDKGSAMRLTHPQPRFLARTRIRARRSTSSLREMAQKKVSPTSSITKLGLLPLWIVLWVGLSTISTTHATATLLKSLTSKESLSNSASTLLAAFDEPQAVPPPGLPIQALDTSGENSLGANPLLNDSKQPYPKKNKPKAPTQRDLTVHTKGNVVINQKARLITLKDPFTATLNQFTYSADNITIHYTSLLHFNFEQINRIESRGNVTIVINNDEPQKITADRYVYSKDENVHVFEAKKNPIIYSDPKEQIVTHDRIEYFVKRSVLVLRGNPQITYYAPGSKLKNVAKFSAGLINVKLDAHRQIDFTEATDNVLFQQNSTSISADYAVYYSANHQIEFYRHVIFKSRGARLSGCSAIYNLALQKGKLLPCSNEGSLDGNYTNPKSS